VLTIPAGVSEKLASDIWELAVVRDQLTSDLTILELMLDVQRSRAYGRALDSLAFPESMSANPYYYSTFSETTTPVAPEC